MNITSRSLLSTLLIAAGILAGANANAASVNVSTSAYVMTPMTIVQKTAMSFGSFVAGSGGTVVLDNANTRTKTGGILFPTGNSGTVASGQQTVSGDTSAAYTFSIALPTSATLTHNTDTSKTMVIGNFTGSTTSGTLASGAATLTQGATLTVSNDQLAGTYSGTYSVTVEYN